MTSPKRNLLIVEDDKDNLLWLDSLFNNEFGVLAFKSPAEALAHLESQKPSVALILTDQVMPEMTGLQFLQQAIKLCPAAFKIMLTGYPKTDDLIEAINQELVDRFIMKPIIPEHLKSVVSEGVKKFEGRLQRLNLNDVGDAIIVLNAQKLIESINLAAEKLLGYTSGEVKGKTFKSLFFEAQPYKYDEYFDAFRGESSKMQFVTRESMGLRKDGTTIPLDLSITRGEMGRERIFVISARSAQKRKLTEERSKFQIYHDQLTGLPNRRLFSDRLATTVSQASKRKEGLAVLSINLDRFQIINNTLGHTIGDQVLEKVASIFSLSTRDGDVVARFAADEFAILLAHVREPQEAARFAQRLLETMSNPLMVGSRELYLSCSVGISLYPSDGETAESLLTNANAAMVAAKKEKGNNYQFFNADLNLQALDRFIFESGLRKGIDRNEFFLYYQPVVEAYNLQIAGVEALIRWNHPELGLVRPSDFIPIAEETGAIAAIGEWVLQTACKQNMLWQQSGIGPFPVMVNVSGRQFRDPRFLDVVKRTLKETGLSSHHLELEVTESLMMENVESTINKLQELKNLGILLCIDDFGTGYSSFSYLKRFPIDVLKIDQSFVRDLGTSVKDAAVASAIIDVAHRLELQVVAEGVETKDQLEFLRSQDCDKLQGFLFSPPMPPEMFSNLKTLSWQNLLGKTESVEKKVR